MHRLKHLYLTESTLQASDRATESTFQSAHRTTYFVHRQDSMTYEVEFTDEFEQWYITLDEATQDLLMSR